MQGIKSKSYVYRRFNLTSTVSLCIKLFTITDYRILQDANECGWYFILTVIGYNIYTLLKKLKEQTCISHFIEKY